MFTNKLQKSDWYSKRTEEPMSGQGPEDPELVVAAGWVNVVEDRAGRFTAQLRDGRHRLIADEPLASGGSDLGPGPYELLLMALGACKTMAERLYAERKQWPSSG